MNIDQAKQVLLRYRPGTSDELDPDVGKALELAAREPALAEWLTAHKNFQTTMRHKVAEVAPPDNLKSRLLTMNKIVPIPLWRRPIVWAAAAAVVVLLVVFQSQQGRPIPDRFADYRTRMVSTALRQYRMDIETKDMDQLRQYLAGKGGPADYVIPQGLRNLALTGGGALKWRSNPVSMVCFDRGDNQMLFLFVMDRVALKDPPAETPQVQTVNEFQTISWSRDGRTYLLAGPAESDFTKKYL